MTFCQNNDMRLKRSHIAVAAILILLWASCSFSQTSIISYQGQFTDSGAPVNGTYLMEFQLFDAPTFGTQIGTSLADIPVVVTNGAFSTGLDFGAGAFTGPDRYLAIAVKKQ